MKTYKRIWNSCTSLKEAKEYAETEVLEKHILRDSHLLQVVLLFFTYMQTVRLKWLNCEIG